MIHVRELNTHSEIMYSYIKVYPITMKPTSPYLQFYRTKCHAFCFITISLRQDLPSNLQFKLITPYWFRAFNRIQFFPKQKCWCFPSHPKFTQRHTFVTPKSSHLLSTVRTITAISFKLSVNIRKSLTFLHIYFNLKSALVTPSYRSQLLCDQYATST